MSGPSVTVAVPVLNEERHLPALLRSVLAQTYDGIVEVLVVDGGSTDRTREVAAVGDPRVRLLDNRRRIQAVALNIALAEAKGDVFVRVDGHCEIEPDYVTRAVDALERTGAAIVGGAMRPVASGWLGSGIAAALTSPLGAGPARFHVGGAAAWVDTVYLGAYRTALAREMGGYAEVAANEDAEFAYRMGSRGGIWFDPSIRSTYVPRQSLLALVRQFYRYGRSRAVTVRRHPRSLAMRQLAAPALVAGLCSPWRRQVAKAYGLAWAGAVAHRFSRQPEAAAGFAVALPAMHISWGAGFLRGLAGTITHR